MEAIEQTVKLLKKIKDKELIEKSLKWLFDKKFVRKNPKIGVQAFKNISDDVYTPESMLGFISELPFDCQSELKK